MNGIQNILISKKDCWRQRKFQLYGITKHLFNRETSEPVSQVEENRDNTYKSF